MGAKMYIKDILYSTRYDKLDDVKGYGKGLELWKDDELFRYLTNAYNEWCRETLCIKDYSTEVICKIRLLANSFYYPMSPRIIAVHKGRLVSGYPNLEVKDDLWLDENVYSWETRTGTPRYLLPDCEVAKIRVVPYFNTDGYFSGTMTFDAAGKSITMAGAKFSTYLAPGDSFNLTGTVLNATLGDWFTVVSATENSLIVNETIVNEVHSAVIAKVMDTMWLNVSRLPKTDLVLAQWETQSPEINYDYHPKLIDGILREAYLKQDAECYDPKAAERHRLLFEQSKTLAKKQKYRLRHSAGVLRPARGAL